MKAQSILWKITSEYNKGNPSYLLGTIHIQSKFAFQNFPKYQELILQCDAYAGESNLDDLSEFQIPGQFDSSYASKYLEVLSKNQYAHLDRLIHKNIPHLDLWPFLHPMLLMSQIEMVLMGTDEQQSLDHALWEFAKAGGKELLAIESANLQRQIFEDIDLDSSFLNIKHAISNMSALRKNYTKLATYYKDQNIQALYLKAKKQLGKMKRPMLYDRNVYMADRIEAIIRNQSVFIGIGVGHLPGEIGVLRLLKHKGYLVHNV